MRSRAPLFLIIATTGCLNEYHPEYHPVTTTTIVQNVSAPTTIITRNDVTPVQAPASSTPPPPSPKIARNEIEPKSAKKSAKSSSCPLPDIPLRPGSIELGPNVAIGPGVYFGGDVYVKGDLIVGGTREHPQLLTQ